MNNHNTPQSPLTLRPRQAAQVLGVSERTLRNLLRSGEIPHAKLNRAVLIPVSGLEAFLASKMEQVDQPDQGQQEHRGYQGEGGH